MNNITMSFSANLSRAEIIIENLKNIGINTSDFETKINEIKIDIESNIKDLTAIGYEQENSINSIYQNGIDKTDKVLFDLKKYQKYYQTINECHYVQGSQDLTEFSSEELDVAVENLIELLKITKEFNGITDNGITSVDTFYDVIYELIKIEFISNGSSKLYEYCRQSEVDSLNISKAIVNEVNAFKERSYYTKIIRLHMSKLDSNNSINLYLDKELIQLICAFKNKDDYLKDLDASLSKLSNELEDIKNKIDGLSFEKEYNFSLINMENNKKTNKAKSVLLNVLPFILTVGSLTGAYFGFARIAKGTEYNTETTTYSSLDKSTETTFDYEKRLNLEYGENVDDMVTIQKNYPFERVAGSKDGEVDFSRTVEITKVTGVDFDDLGEYIDFDYKNIDGEYEYTEKDETKSSLDAEDKYNESYYLVKEQHQNEGDSRIGVLSERSKFLLNVYYGFAVGTIMFLMTVIGFIEEVGPVYRLKKLLDVLKEIKIDKDGIKDAINTLKKVKEEFNKILIENSELKKRYLELIDDPKYKYILHECGADLSSIVNTMNSNEDVATLALTQKNK